MQVEVERMNVPSARAQGVVVARRLGISRDSLELEATFDSTQSVTAWWDPVGNFNVSYGVVNAFIQ